MKPIRSLLLLVFMAGAQLLLSQALPYQYDFWKEPFNSLSNATILPASVWDEEPVDVPLGFSFKLGEKNFQSLEISPYEGSLFKNGAFDNGDTVQAIFGYNTLGLAFKPGAQIAYKLEGTAPDRIFKAEWLKVGIEDENGEVSFQIWLYETSNIIQIKLGPQNVPAPAQTFYNNVSPLIGLGFDLVANSFGEITIGYAHWITGQAQAPADTILYNWMLDDEAPLFGCNGIPVEGAVFTFTPGNITAIQTLPATDVLKFFPNPALDKIYFTKALTTDTGIQILDIQGRLLYSVVLPAGAESLILPGGFRPGTYLIRSIVEGKIAVGKIILLG